MRYAAAEKLEIIRLVEQSSLSVRRTLGQLSIPRSTFYCWYDRYRARHDEGLEDRTPAPRRVWNKHVRCFTSVWSPVSMSLTTPTASPASARSLQAAIRISSIRSSSTSAAPCPGSWRNSRHGQLSWRNFIAAAWPAVSIESLLPGLATLVPLNTMYVTPDSTPPFFGSGLIPSAWAVA